MLPRAGLVGRPGRTRVGIGEIRPGLGVLGLGLDRLLERRDAGGLRAGGAAAAGTAVAEDVGERSLVAGADTADHERQREDRGEAPARSSRCRS